MSLYYICQNMWWGHQEKTKYAVDEDMMMVEDEDGELIENKDDDEVEVVVR